MKKTVLLFVITVVMAAGAAYAQLPSQQFETWDDTSLRENGWIYYGASGAAPVDWAWSGGNGYIVSDLSRVVRWPDASCMDFYPAYCLKPVNLIVNPVIQIQVRDISPAPVQLYGGALEYWIGEEIEIGGVWKATYYAFKQPIAIGSGWTYTTLNLTTNAADWQLIYDDQGKSAADLMGAGLNMHGFRIFGGSSDPVGVLAFDNFAVVPEPAGVLALGSLMAGLTFIRRNRP
jgi:hypothetical protein